MDAPPPPPCTSMKGGFRSCTHEHTGQRAAAAAEKTIELMKYPHKHAKKAQQYVTLYVCVAVECRAH